MGTETYKLGEALQHLCQLFTCIFSGRQRLYVVHTAAVHGQVWYTPSNPTEP